MTAFSLALAKAACLANTSFPEPGGPDNSKTLGGRPPCRNSSKASYACLQKLHPLLSSINKCKASCYNVFSLGNSLGYVFDSIPRADFVFAKLWNELLLEEFSAFVLDYRSSE